jgi:putative sigma-54 modulation protein
MNILVKDVNFNAEEHLKDFARKKAEKMYQFHENVLGVEVNMKLENNKEGENKTAEIRVMVPGNDVFAKKTEKTFEAAIDASILALKKQMEKIKSRS